MSTLRLCGTLDFIGFELLFLGTVFLQQSDNIALNLSSFSTVFGSLNSFSQFTSFSNVVRDFQSAL